MDYVLNRANGVLHKLPASESCNTDAIRSEERFTVNEGEDVVGYIGGVDVRYCTRCFPVSDRWAS